MSFLSCIGKKSKRKKSKNNEPIERDVKDNIEEKENETVNEENEAKENEEKISKSSKVSLNSKKSNTSDGQDTKLRELKNKYEKLQAEVDTFKKEKVLFEEESKNTDDTLKSYIEDIHRLETNNMNLKSKLTRSEAEAAKVTLENQKLMQKIVGMEEKQAMMSRAELQSMISQLEELEKKNCVKSTELSGIRTNPAISAEVHPRKKLSQEEKQMSFRLTKAEARLSQSEDENKKLREDLKDMLATHTELQMQLMLDQKEIEDMDSCMDYFTGDTNNSPEHRCSTSNFDHAENLYLRFKNAEASQSKLREDYSSLQTSYNELEKRLHDAECQTLNAEELKVRLEELECENKRITDSDPGEIRKRLSIQEAEQNRLKEDMKTLEGVCATITSRLDKLTTENNQFRTKHDNMLKQNRNQKNELEKLQSEIIKLKEDNRRLSDENRKLSQQFQKHKDITNGHDNTENLQKELAELRAQYEETLNRLSEVTSQKILQQNRQIKTLDVATITPVSLAHRFRNDLYASEWCTAYQFFTKRMKRDEKRTLQVLLELCTESYLFCKRAARQQIDTIVSSLITPTASHYRSGQFTKRNQQMKSALDHIPEELKRRLSHFRYHPSKEMINSSVKDFLNQLDYERTRFLRQVSERELNEILPYIRKCFEICWCMATQDPPMYLLFKVKHGVDLEKDKFDKYTIHGRRVDFVVWPAVFQDEVGPCLQKGVIQALPERV